MTLTLSVAYIHTRDIKVTTFFEVNYLKNVAS